MSDPPDPISSKPSGGIHIGDLSGDRDVNVTLTDVAGRDKFTITNSPGAVITTNYIQADQKPPLFVGVLDMPNQFVGRRDLMSDLVQKLTSGRSLVFSVEGLPGVGKTTLAVALAHHKDVLAHFSDGVLWGGLGRNPDVLSILGQWAEALGGDVTDLVEPQDRQKAVQNLIGQKRLLLIIDDAWQLEPAQQLHCGGPHCVHLLTTRDKGIARGFAGKEHLTAVSPLTDDPATQLLQALAPAAWDTDPTAVRQLAQAVGGLPLALELLGGYLTDPDAPERSYFPDAAQTALADLSIPAQRLQLAQVRLGSQDGSISLQAAIELSLADLPDTTRAAFTALGAFAPKPAAFSRDAAQTVTAATPRDLALLIERNLVAWDQAQFSLYQILADVAASHLPPEAQVRHRDYYLEQAKADRHAWRHMQTLYEQIQWAWQKAPDMPDTLELLWAVNVYRERRGLWADYLAAAARGLDICQAHGLRGDEAILLNHIGRVYHALGQHQTALEYYQRALPIREEVGDGFGLATTLNNIGLVYYSLGQRQTALEYYQQALPIQEEVEDRAGLAITLNNMGLAYDALGQRQTALDYYQRVLPILEEVGDRATQANTLNNIGAVYDALGQRQTALAYYERALLIQEEVGDRARQATTLNNIGLVYNALGQGQTALEYYERALPIREEVGDRAGQATTLNNIGAVYDALEQCQTALAYYQRAVPIQEEIGDRAGLAATLTNIGFAYGALGQGQTALEYYLRALPIREEVGDPFGESITRFNMATIYRAQGDLAEATAQLRQVVELDRLVQSPDLEADTALLAQLEAELAQQKG